jgi:hypothetical protein
VLPVIVGSWTLTCVVAEVVRPFESVAVNVNVYAPSAKVAVTDGVVPTEVDPSAHATVRGSPVGLVAVPVSVMVACPIAFAVNV